MVSPDNQFVCNGQVTEWRYQGKASSPFRALVWRPIDGYEGTRFRIVGINNIPAGAVNTPVTYTVPDSERITVRAGDVIGWSFGEAVLTYNHDSGGHNYRVRWKGGNLHDNLHANQVHNINTGSEVRAYSIAATVTEHSE